LCAWRASFHALVLGGTGHRLGSGMLTTDAFRWLIYWLISWLKAGFFWYSIFAALNRHRRQTLATSNGPADSGALLLAL
jgi:hypothetical protein